MSTAIDYPLISIIVPNYNKECYLDKCISSILNQTYPRLEIIVIDDCSKDSSISIIKKFENLKPNVKGVFLEQNKGVSYARNYGFMRANGEIVTTIDSDDYYIDCNKIKNEFELLQYFERQNKRIISYSKFIIVDKLGNRTDYKYKEDKKYLQGDIFYNLMTCPYVFSVIPRDYCMRKEYYFNVGGYNFDNNFYEDFDLLLRLAENYEFYFTSEEGTAYRQTENGLSKKRYKDHVRIPLKIKMNYLNHLEGIEKIKCIVSCYYSYLYSELRLKIRDVLIALGVKKSD